MTLAVVFPPEVDEPAPSIRDLSTCTPPGPLDPQPTQSIDPSLQDVPGPEPQVSRQPEWWEVEPPPLPQSQMPPPQLKVDLTGLSDDAPPIGPLPTAPNPFDFWP